MSTGKSSRTRKRSATQKAGDQKTLLSAALLKTVDLGIGAIIFVAPHLFGGRHPLGRFVIVALCVATAIAWFARQFVLPQAKATRVVAWIVPVLASLVVVFQLVPIPAEWMPILSPRLAELLPLWSDASSTAPHIGTWQTLSLAPEETRLALATLIAYALLFVTLSERLETTDDIARLMKMIGLSAVVVAGFGIIQYFTSNGKFFWFYDYPFTNTDSVLKAGFTNRNHFAHFLVLGLAMLLGWVMLERHSANPKSRRSQASNSSQRWSTNHSTSPVNSWSIAALLLLVACTILASLSRGGILAMAAAILVATVIYTRAKLFTSNHLMAGGLMVVLAMAALSISGKYGDVTNRLDGLVSQEIHEIDSIATRQTIWNANLESIRAGWLTGSGAGTHRFIYPAYLSEPADMEYTHAENGYLQIATENGLPGVILLAVTIFTCCYWCIATLRNADRNAQLQILTGSIAAALAASVVHSIVDFVWFIPACTCTTLLLVAALLRMYELSRSVPCRSTTNSHLAPITRFNISLGVTLSGVWAVATLLAPGQTALEWDTYLRASLASKSSAAQQTFASARQQETLNESENLNSSSMLKHLTSIVRDYPQSARAQARLAALLLGTFEKLQLASDNAMPVSQIREAAQASQFQSADQLRGWLRKAFGEHCRLLYQAHYHARRALELCPLQGESYLCLAELCFLEGSSEAAYDTYAQQGLIVCPCDSELLFAVGKKELIAGNETEALRHWTKSFRGAGTHRNHIIHLSASGMPASRFLEVYAPEWDTLDSVWNTYRLTGNPAELEVILSYASNLAVEATSDMPPHAASGVWLSLAKMQLELTGPQVAVKSLQQGYLLSPDRFAIRYELGKCLMALEEFTAAESHLQWCYQQFPNNPKIRRDLERATRGTLQQLARSTQTRLH
ncbi:O-antigen ligase family protein [Bythopirellula polymerisocia]|uniref:O-Antigen ligase n=1 Tax=Bythopirellula polymerisocia TaxID=2528003 RepID=A0A5C6CI82_9BACT|nr:O-antigen ligase family protein [Bythopirellula polymerisocia]TWU23795.1 O-Antigen ligase [Bythopirellula polymerisocia]